MPHIHTQPGQHDHTVSMYLFRLDFDEPKILLHLHKKLGSYMQFGGHIELNETPWQSVAHELREETGYDLGQVKIMQPAARLKKLTAAAVHPVAAVHNTHPVSGDHYHIDSAYMFVTRQEPEAQPDEGESTDLRLFARGDIAALPQNEILENVREGILYMFDHLLSGWEPVDPAAFK